MTPLLSLPDSIGWTYPIPYFHFIRSTYPFLIYLLTLPFSFYPLLYSWIDPFRCLHCLYTSLYPLSASLSTPLFTSLPVPPFPVLLPSNYSSHHLGRHPSLSTSLPQPYPSTSLYLLISTLFVLVPTLLNALSTYLTILLSVPYNSSFYVCTPTLSQSLTIPLRFPRTAIYVVEI